MTTDGSAESQLKAILRLEAELPTSWRCASGETIEFRHDFDHEEIRVRRPGQQLIRLDDQRLIDFIDTAKIERTEKAVAELLCAICSDPKRYQSLIIG